MHPGELVDILDTTNEESQAAFARGIFIDEYVNDWSGPHYEELKFFEPV